jgi:hypothetical protein
LIFLKLHLENNNKNYQNLLIPSFCNSYSKAIKYNLKNHLNRINDIGNMKVKKLIYFNEDFFNFIFTEILKEFKNENANDNENENLTLITFLKEIFCKINFNLDEKISFYYPMIKMRKLFKEAIIQIKYIISNFYF